MTVRDAPVPRGVALAVWGTALVAYVIAVTGRTSLGVAGLAAAERFDVGASVLSLFVVIQLAVYAGAQIPVGIALDRVGSRRLIAGGALVLAAGQLLLALADSLPLALVARVLIGLGDATAFVSVLRLVPAWFPARRVPVLTQLTGIIGQTGQIISAVPFLALLGVVGWTPAFVSLAAAGVLVAVLVALVVRDAPAGQVSTGRERRPGGAPLSAAFREPGAWLGFFTHFLGLFPVNTFMLLWGVPYMTEGLGYGAATASAVLTVSALSGVLIGPVMGVLVARHPMRRSWLVLGNAAVMAVVWAALLVPDGPRPVWQLIVLAVALAGSGAASNIGFDYARSFVPPARLGTATGLVNVGGFTASLVSVFAVGLVLDLVRPTGSYELDDFRVAWTVMAGLWLVGVGGVLLTRRPVRRALAAAGTPVRPVREALRRGRPAHP